MCSSDVIPPDVLPRLRFDDKTRNRYAGKKVEFDMRRTSTVVSPRGRVHLEEHSGFATACDIDLMGRGDWSDNVSQRQPNCRPCIAHALRWPARYFFSEVP
jgi:hypothetical protein